MLRLVLLVLVLASSYLSGLTKAGGGWDPDGLTTQPPPPADQTRGLDPDGLNAPTPSTTTDGGGGLDPDG
jgi:hypothetical protein